jgi:hypothetical protein
MTDAGHAFARAYAGEPERHRRKAAEQGKLPVRERVALLLDAGSFSEDALDLRDELVRGFARYVGRHRALPPKRHGIPSA